MLLMTPYDNGHLSTKITPDLRCLRKLSCHDKEKLTYTKLMMYYIYLFHLFLTTNHFVICNEVKRVHLRLIAQYNFHYNLSIHSMSEKFQSLGTFPNPPE